MDKKIKTFQYISRNSEPKLEELIDRYIYEQRNYKYIELTIDSITKPIQIGYAHYDIHDKSPKFEIIVTFNSREMTSEEIENIENCKDVIYDLVIRKNLKDDVVFKIDNKEIEFHKYFKIVKPIKRIYEDDNFMNGFYEKLIKPIGTKLGYEPSRNRYEIKDWIINTIFRVIFFDETVRLNF